MVDTINGPHPAGGSNRIQAMRRPAVSEVESVDPPPPRSASADEFDLGGEGGTVHHLNEAAVVYQALAAEIEGMAVGWSPQALARLERGLAVRYGAAVGGRHAIRRLVRLATQSRAA